MHKDICVFRQKNVETAKNVYRKFACKPDRNAHRTRSDEYAERSALFFAFRDDEGARRNVKHGVAQRKKYQQNHGRGAYPLRKIAKGARGCANPRAEQRKIQQRRGPPFQVGERPDKGLQPECEKVVREHASRDGKRGNALHSLRAAGSAHADQRVYKRDGRHIHCKMRRREQRRTQFRHFPSPSKFCRRRAARL